VLSQGVRAIPEFWKPALSVKLGRSRAAAAAPLGILHSCPGMDWRHTGLPPAEYAFWLAQIPAYGGQIWHSLTGVPDTIRDKRIIRIVTEHNRKEEMLAEEMSGAESLAGVALLWRAGKSTEGWADGLVNRQIPFDILPEEAADSDALGRYRTVIVPEHYPAGAEEIARWKAYVKQGGNLIVEGSLATDERKALAELLGIESRSTVGESLVASYLRFEGAGNPLQSGMEDTEIIPHRGRVVYCKPLDGTRVLATLVPSFSPLESTGAPPERASLPVEHTDIPLALLSEAGQGRVLYAPFSLSALIDEFKLGEHYQLLNNIVETMTGEARLLRTSPIIGLQATLYRNGEGLLLHLVNGTGRRPLANAVPLHGIEVRLNAALLPNAASVSGLLENGELPFEYKDGELTFTVTRLDVWDAIKLR
jgi:hypothetical protein